MAARSASVGREAPRRRKDASTTLLAGIDEAGLGPLLGPLTIGYAAFRVPSQVVREGLLRFYGKRHHKNRGPIP